MTALHPARIAPAEAASFPSRRGFIQLLATASAACALPAWLTAFTTAAVAQVSNPKSLRQLLQAKIAPADRGSLRKLIQAYGFSGQGGSVIPFVHLLNKPIDKPIDKPVPTVPPGISVTPRGQGTSAVFDVTGSGFSPNASVSVRVVRVGDGIIPDVRFPASSTPSGTISLAIPLPCASGVTLYFSATDGRTSHSDLTGFLWSNTSPTTCPF
jgi:hypothetical protein